MILPLIRRSLAKILGRVSLGTVLTIPVVLQTLGVVVVTSYLSFLNGQQVVNGLVEQLLIENSYQIDLYLNNFLDQSRIISRINADAVRLGQINLTDLSQLETKLATQISQFPNVSSILYGSTQGELRGATKLNTGLSILVANQDAPRDIFVYSINSQNARGGLKAVNSLLPGDRNITDRPWYQAAVSKNRLTWSPIFSRFSGHEVREFTLNAANPVYNPQGELQGVMAVNLDLMEISYFLNQMFQIKGGEVFIVERSGALVASSDGQKPFRQDAEGNLARIAAIESSNPLIQAAAQYLQTQDIQWQRMQSAKNFHFHKKFQSSGASSPLKTEEEQILWGWLNSDNYFIRTTPYQDPMGVDWLVVVVVPESSFMGQVQQNTYITVIFCIIALVIGISCGVWTTRWLVEPLSRLSRAAKAISKGNFPHPVQIDRLDEVGELGEAFNQMALQVRFSLEELRASNEKFRRLVENIPGVVYRYVLRADGGEEFTYVSPQLQDIYGLQPELVMADSNLVWQEILPEDLELMRQLRQESFQHLAPWSAEYRVCRDGQITWYQGFSTPELQPNGDVVWDGVIFNINDRKRAEEFLANYNQVLTEKVGERTTELSQMNKLLKAEIAQRRSIEANLAESEARLQDILDTANASIILIRVDSVDYKPEIIYLSKGHGAVFGYSPEEVMNIKGLWRSRIHPEDISKVFFARAQEICTLGSAVLEYRFYHKDGKVRWISDNVVSRWDETAQCWLVTAVAIDITDRKLAEAERLSQQVFLRQIIDLVPAAIFVKDREGRYLTVNQTTANRYGTTVEAMNGKTAKDFNPNPEEVIDYEINNQEVMDTRRTKIIPSRLSWNSGRDPSWNQVIISPFINAQGEVQGVVGISIDVTGIKQVEEELRQAKEAAEAANRAKSLFLAKMSHELRTPLNAILGFSKIMQPHANLTPEQKQNLAIICHSGEHLLSLINQVLDLSKIESQKITINYQKCDLHALLKEVEEMFSLKAQNKNLWLTCSHTPDTPQYIYTDPTKLRQILINLLSNGLKFTKVGGVSLLVGYQPLDQIGKPKLDGLDSFDRPNNINNLHNINNEHGSENIGNINTGNINELNNSNRLARLDSLNDLDIFCSSELDISLDGSHLRVGDELLPMAGYVVFRITDTGVGIDPQEFPLLFQPFSQTNSGQQIQKGTGLGLHLSQQFVRLLGGGMTVSSQVGKGSTFKFNLSHFSRDLPVTNSPTNQIDSQDSSTNPSNNLPVNSSNNSSNKLSPNSHVNSSANLAESFSEDMAENPLSNDLSNIANNINGNTLQGFSSNNIGYYDGDLSTMNILSNISLFNSSLPDLVSENIPPLSSNWLLNFQRSIIQGDIIVVRSLIQEIALSHPLLYQTLNHLADEYKLEQLLDLAQALKT